MRKRTTSGTLTHSAQPMIVGGFVALLILLATLFLVWFQGESEHRRLMDSAMDLPSEVRHIYQMRDAASRRVLLLLQMLQLSEDPFLVDDLYVEFQDAGSKFLVARESLLDPNVSEFVLHFWEKLVPHVNLGGQVQQKAVQLILDNRLKEAREVIAVEVAPTQNIVLAMLDDMLTRHHRDMNRQIVERAKEERESDFILVSLAMVIFGLGIFIARFVTSRSAQSESQLREQRDRVRAMYDVSSVSGLSLNEQIGEMLRLGCQLTGMDVGCLLQLGDANSQHYGDYENNKIISAINSQGGKENFIGEHLLHAQLCFKNLKSGEVDAFENCAVDGIYVPQVNNKALFESYIGTSLVVHNKKYGVLCFVSDQFRNDMFTEMDKSLMSLMGNWMSVTLERILEQSELASAKNIAESASQAKSSFIANMSHEMRTPLTSIIGFADMLLDGERSSKEKHNAARTIIRSSEYLHELINDILDMSKIEAGQLVVENIPVSPLSIVAEVESVMAPRAREKGLVFNAQVDYPLPETILSDPTRLKQILLNLCSNATKFTASGEVCVRTEFDIRHREIIFTVTDTGIGMDGDEIEHLFQPFAQADSSTTRRFGGTGLGLWISRQLAECLAGNISCESKKGKGSCFVVRLSIGDVEQLKLIHAHSGEGVSPFTAAPGAGYIPQLRGRILLVEDSPDIQVLVSVVAAKTGAELVVVANGQEAVEAATAEVFDLVLMDMQMPVMGGMEATRCLRKEGYSGAIVALTANAMKKDKQQSKAAGFDGYLTKPLIIHKFYDTLALYLRAGKQMPADGRVGNFSASVGSDAGHDDSR